MQKSHWKVHKRICGNDAGSHIMNQHDMQHFLNAMGAGSSKAWHDGLKSSRVIERFIMSWQLRVEDLFNLHGLLVGYYAEEAGAPPGTTM